MPESQKRTKTHTPTIELGRTTHTPTESNDGHSEDELEDTPDVIHDVIHEERNGSGDWSEAQRLLRHSEGESPKEINLKRSEWISIFGFSIPKSLAVIISIPIILIFLYIIAHAIPSSSISLPTISNGTVLFHPTVLLISLDGFRPSYLTSHPHLLPNLLSLSNSSLGLRAESMQPCFPSQTFPNHWSIMTGLYPESHGIIANDFWDPVQKKHFVYTKKEQSWDGDWWWGEPMWSVAERGGRISANIMWPGPPSTSEGIAPSLFVPYRKMTPKDKLDQVMEWLDMPIRTRPQLITTYIPNVDQMGHKGGPDSELVNEALGLVDDFVGGVIRGLSVRNLSEIVNVLIVSDHVLNAGMTSTANERLIYLDDILGEKGYNDIEHRDGLRFKEGSPVDEYLDILLRAAEGSNGAFAVYTKETMPDRWHFTNTERIAPIFMVPKIGWAITDNHEHKVINKGDYSPKGNHGYDNIEPDMQAIFMAHGPFARDLKTNAQKRSNGRVKKGGWVSTSPHVMESFANLEIYSLVMRLMGLEGLEPAHNGTKGFWDDYLL